MNRNVCERMGVSPLTGNEHVRFVATDSFMSVGISALHVSALTQLLSSFCEAQVAIANRNVQRSTSGTVVFGSLENLELCKLCACCSCQNGCFDEKYVARFIDDLVQHTLWNSLVPPTEEQTKCAAICSDQ